MKEFVDSFSDMLSAHGGWGLAAVMAFVLRWLFLRNDDERKARHQEFVTLLKETQDMLGSVAVLIQKCQGPRNDD